MTFTRAFFLTTSRLGFSKWQPEVKELARSRWGDPQVNQFIAMNGSREQGTQDRPYQGIHNKKTFYMQYRPVFLQESKEQWLFFRACYFHGFTCVGVNFLQERAEPVVIRES